MLVAIALRNLIELSSSDVDELSVLPKAFKIIRSSSLLWAIFAVSFFRVIRSHIVLLTDAFLARSDGLAF